MEISNQVDVRQKKILQFVGEQIDIYFEINTSQTMATIR